MRPSALGVPQLRSANPNRLQSGQRNIAPDVDRRETARPDPPGTERFGGSRFVLNLQLSKGTDATKKPFDVRSASRPDMKLVSSLVWLGVSPDCGVDADAQQKALDIFRKELATGCKVNVGVVANTVAEVDTPIRRPEMSKEVSDAITRL